MSEFENILGQNCSSLFHNEYSCMLRSFEFPAGPFPVAQWAIFIVPKDLEPI
jgi:hypothetical protein